jgi:ParB/RepB/Spo0J family partition protein
VATKQNEIKVSMLDPKQLQVPDVRITSTWEPEMLKMFKASVAAEGIQNPLIIVKENGNYWIVDGLHRQQEALLKGISLVPCIVTDGSMRKVMTKNLYMNRLRGGIKASEMILVIKWLYDHEGMNSEAIKRETGLNREYIEKLLATGKAVPEVLEALDKEEIGVGHAYEISRITEKDVQLRLLAQIFQYRLTVKDLRTVVDDTITLLNARAAAPQGKEAPEPIQIPKIRCHACEEEYPLKKVSGVNLCVHCYGILIDQIRKRRKAEQTVSNESAAVAPSAPSEPVPVSD